MRERTEQVDVIILGGDTRTAAELARYGVNVMVCSGRSADEISGTRIALEDDERACTARLGDGHVRIESER